MSGENVPALEIPPGVVRNGTPYAVGRRWRDANWIRWINGSMTSIGGWSRGRTFGVTENQIVRDAFSWRDNLKNPWYAVGTETTLQAASPISAIRSIYNITPAGMLTNVNASEGYGSGLYGAGPYGVSESYSPTAKRGFGAGKFGRFPYGTSEIVTQDKIGQWSMDNYGRLLVAVHSHDGRLFSWDPVTPTIPATPVTNAPIDSTLVVVTDERMVMLLGGKNNPRRVKWCDRENINTWTASATNTAGGFELNSQGSIIAAVKVQGGILVITDVDAHIIEYVGGDAYYSRRRIAEEVGCIGKNALVGVAGTAFWLSREGFWKFDGTVTPVQSPVDSDVLQNGNLTSPENVFLGFNGYNKEVWAFYPKRGSSKPDRYVFVSMSGDPYWSIGSMQRTAFLNPVWDTKPIMWSGVQEYYHEVGLLADGQSRVGSIYAETGQFEIATGNRCMRVDRIIFDGTEYDPATGLKFTSDYSVTFKLRQAPAAPERIAGPFTPNNISGINGARFQARSIAVRVEPIKDAEWSMGKLRLRMREGSQR